MIYNSDFVFQRREQLESDKTVYLPVGFNQCFFTLFPGFGISMLHSHNTCEAFFMNVPEDIQEIDLSGGRLSSARIIPTLEITYLIICKVNIRDQVSFMNLLMIDIKEDLT